MVQFMKYQVKIEIYEYFPWSLQGIADWRLKHLNQKVHGISLSVDLLLDFELIWMIEQ